MQTEPCGGDCSGASHVAYMSRPRGAAQLIEEVATYAHANE